MHACTTHKRDGEQRHTRSTRNCYKYLLATSHKMAKKAAAAAADAAASQGPMLFGRPSVL